jgi:hypothetical protein
VAPGRRQVSAAEAPDEDTVAAGAQGQGREPRGRRGARERRQDLEEVGAERRDAAGSD